ncbi:GDSL-type esterase/lipase family protein [Shouchella rhizosphaerae]|uniref:GDSL-type esterase/lipase family protein n=1 Tax=Shouchella rhizosphaerae TaxID=866786 RepID=A0ABZ2CTB7_9BACI
MRNRFLIPVFVVFTGLVLIISYTHWQNKVSHIAASASKEEPDFSNPYERKTFKEKLENGLSIKTLIIGDSIGDSMGTGDEEHFWYNQIREKIESEHGSNMRFEKLTRGGATTFDGLFDLIGSPNRNVYDLAIVVYGQNDKGLLSVNEFESNYKNLISLINMYHPASEIVTVIENSLDPDNEYADIINSLADEYGTILVDMREPFTSTNGNLTVDGIHPNNDGYNLYADAIYEAISEYSGDSEVKTEEPVYTEKLKLSFKDSQGFTALNGSYYSDEKGSFIEYEFEGNAVAVSFSATENSGTAKAYINGELVNEFNLYAPDGRPKHFLVANELGDGQHTLKIEVTGTPSVNYDGDSTEGIEVNLLGAYLLR